MTDWFVATTGLIGNTGAIGSPWDITSAWSGHSGAIQPGDNIWMRGGTYQKTNSNFTISVSGAVGSGVDNADQKVIIRNYQGEHVIVEETNTGNPPTGVDNTAVSGSFVWIWGLDFRCVLSQRTAYVGGPSCVWLQSTPSIGANTDGNKVIHCTLREGGGNGVFSDTHTGRSEIYGCLSFNNGYAQSPGAHGLYVHHQGTKVFTIEGNVCFNMEGFGTQLYSVADAHDFIEYIDYKNNILFNAGALNNIASLGGVDAVLLEFGGASDTMNHMNVLNNWGYQPGNLGDRMIEIGQGGTSRIGAANVVDDNYMIGGGQNSGFGCVYIHSILGAGGALEFQRNTFKPNTGVAGNNYEVWITDSTYSGYNWGNTKWLGTYTLCKTPAHTFGSFAQWKSDTGFSTDTNPVTPTVTQVAVIPTKRYEDNRGLVAYYNWESTARIAVDLSTILTSGDTFDVHDVRDDFGAAITVFDAPAAGSPVTTYTGATVYFPTTQVADPTQSGSAWGVGNETVPVATAPFFNVFTVRKTGHPPTGAGKALQTYTRTQY